MRQRPEIRRFAPGRRQGKVSKDKRSVLLPIPRPDPQPERGRAADSFPERTIRRRSVPFYRQISDSVAITGSGNFFHNHYIKLGDPAASFRGGVFHCKSGERNGVLQSGYSAAGARRRPDHRALRNRPRSSGHLPMRRPSGTPKEREPAETLPGQTSFGSYCYLCGHDKCRALRR